MKNIYRNFSLFRSAKIYTSKDIFSEALNYRDKYETKNAEKGKLKWSLMKIHM